MKTLIHHLKRFSIYTLLLGAVGFAGCEDENRQDMTPEIGVSVSAILYSVLK